MKVTEQATFGGVDSRSNAINFPPDRCIFRRNFLIEKDGSIRLRDGFTPVAMQYAPAGIPGVVLVRELTVDNGTFEAATIEGWQASQATLGLETSNPQSGSQSLVVNGWVQYGAARSVRQYPVTPGQGYRISGYVNNGGVAGVAAIQLGFLDENGVYLGGIQAADDSADTAWHAVSASGVVLPGAVSAFISLQTNSPTGGLAYFDGIRLFQVGFPPIHSHIGLTRLTDSRRFVLFAQDRNFPSAPIATISAVQIQANVLTITTPLLNSDQITYLSGRKMQLTGLTTATFLNDTAINVTSAGNSGGVGLLTANTTHDSYVQAADTGNVEAIIGFGLLDPSIGVVYQPDIAGKPLSGSGIWSWALANNRLHGTNGVDTKFLMQDTDGTWRFRDIGIRAPTAAEAAAVTVADGGAQAGAVPASTVGGAQPGYQLYMAFWNRVTGAVGNRVKIGGRILFTDAEHIISLTGLPDLSTEDSELDTIIGRTSDGAEVPYPIVDTEENWVYVPNGTTATYVSTPSFDGASEMPVTNSPPPATTRAFARVGDYVHAIVSDGPWCYRSEVGVDDPIDSGHVGRPEQNWGTNPETFPTGERPIAVHGYNGDAWYQTENDLAIMVDQQGIMGWQGPWPDAGIAGQNAFAVAWKGFPYWINGHKQLWTMTADGPIGISDEYETALLSKIGDAYLSQVQLVPFRDVELKLELLTIKARDKDGNPFVVIHDFNARDANSPYGQALEVIYGNVLGADFNIAALRDASGRVRLWASAYDGYLYQLFDGVNDNGTEFSADLISLLYIGEQRTAVKYIEWYGDENVQFSISDKLDITLTDDRWIPLSEGPPDKVPSDENNPHFQVAIPDPEMIHAYVRISLDSHSQDAPAQGMKLSDPPHLPVNTYGRVLMIAPLTGTSRGK